MSSLGQATIAKGKIEQAQQRITGAVNNLDVALTGCITVANTSAEAANHMREASRMATGGQGDMPMGIALSLSEITTVSHEARRVIQEAKQKLNQIAAIANTRHREVEIYINSLMRPGGF